MEDFDLVWDLGHPNTPKVFLVSTISVSSIVQCVLTI